MDIDVQLACRLLFVDMEGLNDGRAVKTIVPQVNPRKMVSRLQRFYLQDNLIASSQILVSASESATNALIESCGNIRAMTKDIYAPSVGESIQIGQQTNTFSISISEDLLTSLRMSRVSVHNIWAEAEN
jgi:cleavage and polyadenylation specificity factor subunit 2